MAPLLVETPFSPSSSLRSFSSQNESSRSLDSESSVRSFSSTEESQHDNDEHRGRRRHRVRACTLVPGSSVHAAFFGDSDAVREEFDQQHVCVTYCNNRRLTYQRQGSTDSSSSSSSIKPGRPSLARYGSF